MKCIEGVKCCLRQTDRQTVRGSGREREREREQRGLREKERER